MPVSLPRSIVALRTICLRVVAPNLICSMVALGAICCATADTASAQTAAPAATAPAPERPPKEMLAGVKADGTPLDISRHRERNPRQLWSIVAPMFSSTDPATPLQLETLDTFTLVRLAEFTWPAVDPNDAASRPENRRMYMKYRELLKASGADEARPQLHDRINAVLLANLPAMISDKEYSLTARYNAMLLLGQLDQIEYDSAKQRAAVPLVAAEKLLLDASKASALPEVLRVAAFIGLARHAELQIPTNSPQRGPIAAEALAMLTATAPPQGISETGLQWIRKLSLQIIMGMSQRGSEVNQPQYVKAIVKILDDAKQPLFLRRDAALALGSYDAKLIMQAEKQEAVVKAMANLTVEVMKAGASRENPDAPADLTKAEDIMQTPTDANRKEFAEAVNYYLNCIAAGLGGRTDARGNPVNKGLLTAATGEPKKQIDDLLKSIDPTVAVLSKSNARPDEMTTKLATEHDKLEKWAGEKGLLATPTPAATSVPAASTAPAAGGATTTPPTGGQILPSSTGAVFAAPTQAR